MLEGTDRGGIREDLTKGVHGGVSGVRGTEATMCRLKEGAGLDQIVVELACQQPSRSFI
jgi:hypothetical protein